MTTFFRFPHTAHLAWLGESKPREDKVLSLSEAKSFLENKVTIEEKIDGANVGFSLGEDGKINAQNRGQYLPAPNGQFSRLPAWIAEHQDKILSILTKDIILFGEWCAAKHTLKYTALPDWFLLFDVYDRRENIFWNTARRNALGNQLGLATVPCLFEGKTTLEAVTSQVLTTKSRYGNTPVEGVVIRNDSEYFCKTRTKLVSPNFTQAITSHWSQRKIEWNRVTWSEQ